MSSILTNTQNAYISGGSFTNVGGNLVVQGAHRPSGFDLLREHCAPSALLDSKERFNPPRCAIETRQEIIQYILDWIEDDEESATMLWLFGAAGAGKTALCQTIGEIYQQKKRLAGSFFFSRTAPSFERNDGDRLIPTLSLQLTEAFPQTRKRVEKTLRDDPDIFSKSRRTQMDQLFILPSQARTTKGLFKKLFGSMPPTHLIIIDGLDECRDVDIQYDILRIIASSLPRLSVPLRFLVSSRAESHIVRVFNHDRALLLASPPRIDLGEDQDAGDAIRRFLTREFDAIKCTHPLRAHLDASWPSEEIVQHLVEKSSTQFIYPSTIMRYIQEPRARPDERLEIILGKCPPPLHDKPFAHLDSLYAHVLSPLDELKRVQLITVIGILYLALSNEHHCRYVGTTPAKLEDYLDMRPGDMTMLLDDFQSLIALPRSRLEPIRILHISLYDFFLDKSRSGHLHMDLGLARNTLAEHALRQWQARVTRAHDKQCFRFLLHCYEARLSNGMTTYLQSFPDLYRHVIGKIDCNDLRTLLFLPFIFQLLFRTLLRKDFVDGLAWHSFHTKRMKKHLLSFLTEKSISDADKESSKATFSDPIYQSRHEVYEALARLIFSGANRSEAERNRLFFSCYSLTAKYSERHEEVRSAMKHLLLSSLPYCQNDAIDMCTLYASLIRMDLRYEDELDDAVRSQVVGYLRRMQTKVNLGQLHNCMHAWGLNLEFEWIPGVDNLQIYQLDFGDVDETCEFDQE